MAKTATATVDMQVAQKQKSFDKSRENVAAAMDSLDSVSVSVAKSTQIVKRRLEELDELVAMQETRIHEMVRAHDKEIQEMRDQYTRDTTALQTKLTAAEEKLRKVQATLA